MREDLETAMGVAITCRSACAMLLEDPVEYAEIFGLTELEVAALATMAEDLAALMPSFVEKRERTLRRAMRLTLEILGEDGDDLVEEYSDEHPAVEKMAADMTNFADFLVESLRARAGEVAYGPILVDLARFERLRLRCFGTPEPLWPAPGIVSAEARELALLRPLRLHPSVLFDTFGWDLRTVRGAKDLARVPVDPCTMLFFQWGRQGSVRVLRLDDATARAVEVVARRPAELNATEVCAAVGADRGPLETLKKLVGQGVLGAAA